MKLLIPSPIAFLTLALVLWPAQFVARGQCATCHSTEVNKWAGSAHANTQLDVATELSQSHPGEAPASVVAGEDCVACHGPTAVSANGGMTEAQALAYFFTTTNGLFSDATAAANNSVWPHVACTGCHSVPTNHSLHHDQWNVRRGYRCRAYR